MRTSPMGALELTTQRPSLSDTSTCRLLYLLGQLRPGGQERQLYYLLKALDGTRCRPAIAVWNVTTRDERYVQDLRDLEVPIFSCPEGVSATAKLAELRRLMAALQPELIHSYCFYMNVIAWSLARSSKAIPIGSIRQDFSDERWRLGGLKGRVVGALSARLPAVQIFNSLTAKQAAEKCTRLLKPQRMYVVRNGIDLGRFQFSPPNERRRLIAVGRLEAEKRWDRLLKALQVLSARGWDFSLSLAGDGPLRHNLQLQARELGISDRVHFLGRRHDIPSLLEQSSFLVHTADAEGCPNAVLEAMAAGRAVVATDAGDVPHLIEHGKTGFVVARGDDVTAFANFMTKLISDPELTSKMGQAARRKAEREFGLERLAAETLTAYRAAGWQD